MSPESNRKALLSVAVVAMLATAGCTGILGSDASAGTSAELDSVPADAQMVGYVDVAGLVSDDALRRLANAMFDAQAKNSPYYVGPENVSELLDRTENESGLDPMGVRGVTFFSLATDSSGTSAGSAAMILTTTFSEDELVSALREEGTEFSNGTYKGTTVYTYGFAGNSALAVLGDGTFAIGDKAAVESVVDVRAGDRDALGGALRAAFENTHEGYVRFAIDVPERQIPADRIVLGSPVNLSAFNTIQYVSGSFYTSGETINVDLSLTSESESSAARVYDVIEGALSLYSGMVDAELRAALEELSVTQNGATVTVSYTNTVSELEALIAQSSSTASGTASGSGTASDSGTASGSGTASDSGTASASSSVSGSVSAATSLVDSTERSA